jgi:hypothetical protein
MILHKDLLIWLTVIFAVFNATCFVTAGSLEILEEEHSVSAKQDGRVLWTYNHNPAEGKPYFHPLSSTDGTMFTDLRPGDHPSNFNHPTKWYIYKSMPFFSPVVIHDAPHTIKAGDNLNLKYRLVISPGTMSKDVADKAWKAWVE